MQKPNAPINITPIGTIHSPWTDRKSMAIQSAGAVDKAATVEVLPEFAEGLQDLEGFSHIWLLYHFHKSENMKMKVIPFMDTQEHGVFATRFPHRPNGIGMSVVRLAKREGNILHILDADMLDGTPVLDIKPYFEDFDVRTDTRRGWLPSPEELDLKNRRTDQDSFRSVE